MATRSQIEARMADILNRTDFTDRITIWFQRAYTSIQRRFNFKCMEVTETMISSEGLTSFPIPGDIKKSRLLYLWDTTQNTIITRYREGTLEEVRGYPPFASACGCEPVFTNWYGTLLFAPALTGHTGQSLRYDYYRFLTPVDNDWFMTYAEDFLVYRGLAESAPFLASDPRLGIWAGIAKEAYEELWRQEQDQEISGPLWIRG